MSNVEERSKKDRTNKRQKERERNKIEIKGRKIKRNTIRKKKKIYKYINDERKRKGGDNKGNDGKEYRERKKRVMMKEKKEKDRTEKRWEE